MKKVKHSFAVMLSVLLTAGAIFSFPFAAGAADIPNGGSTVGADVHIKGTIQVVDELGHWWKNNEPDVRINDGPGDFFVYMSPDDEMYDGDMQKSFNYAKDKGFSYDNRTNTLTIKNVSLTSVNKKNGKTYKNYSYALNIYDMEDLKIKVVGENELTAIHINNTQLTVTGDGKLNLNPALSWLDGDIEMKDQYLGLFMPVQAEEGSVVFDKEVTVTIAPGSDELWNVYEGYPYGLMSFSFEKKPANNDFFKAAGEVSEKIQWKNMGGQYVKQFDPAFSNVYLIHHKFPAGKIMKLEGYEGEDNYWIRSGYYSETQTYYTRLKKMPSGWCEDFTNTYCDHSGVWHPVTEMSGYYNSLYVDYSKTVDEPVFTPYEDFSAMPDDLVRDGTAEAYVSLSFPSSGYKVYTKDGHDYMMVLSYYATEKNGYYYNEYLQATDPPAPELGSYSLVMLQINETADLKYLTYAESIYSTKDFNTYINKAANDDDQNLIAGQHGYERKMEDHSYTSAYLYCVVNRKGLTFKGKKAVDLSKCTISGIADKTYTGKNVTQTPIVKDGSKVLVKDTDYTLAYKNNKAAGTATVTISGKGNYTGSVSRSFKIKQKAFTKDMVSLKTVSMVFTGRKLAPVVTVKYGSTTLKKGTDYTVAYKNNLAVGNATVTITGKGNFTGTVNKVFTIKKAANPIRVKVANKTVKYAKIKAKAVTVSGCFAVSKAKGTVTFARAKVNQSPASFLVNKNNGSITVKKKTKKGVYKVTVAIKAAGNRNYNAKILSKTVQIVVK